MRIKGEARQSVFCLPMQGILLLTEWVLAMSTWICHMATKKKEWSRRALCVGNQNKPVRDYSRIKLTKSLWPSKVSIFIKTVMSDSQSSLDEWETPDGDVMKCAFVFCALAHTAAPFTQAAAAFGIFQLRVNLQV